MLRQRLRLIAFLLLSVAGMAAAPDSASLLNQADTLLAQRNFSRAHSFYEQALAAGAQLDSDPLHARNLALSCLNGTPPDLPGAIKWFRLAKRVEPGDDATRASLARALVRNGDLDGAVEEYRALVARNPHSSEYVLALAGVQQQAGRSNAALQALQSALDLDPKAVPVRLQHARLLNFTGQFAAAKQQFLQVLGADPANVIALVGVAKATSFAGDQETAITLYDRILNQHPGLYDAQIGKAFALLWSGHSDTAKSLFEQGLRRHPGDQEVREALAGLSTSVISTPVGHVPSPKFPQKSKPPQYSKLSQPPVKTVFSPPPTLPQPEVSAPSARSPIPSESTPDSSRRNWTLIAGCMGGVIIILTLAARLFRASPASDHVSPCALNAEPLIRSTELNLGVGETAPDLPSQCLNALPPAVPPAEVAATQPDAKPAGAGIPPVVENAFVAAERAVSRKRAVLLVGGSEAVAELQTRWLAVQNAEARWERRWLPAIVRFLQTPPEVLVLNVTTEDGWTGRRMLNWIAANCPELHARCLVVLAATEAPALHADSTMTAGYIQEPFGAREWQATVGAMLARAPQ